MDGLGEGRLDTSEAPLRRDLHEQNRLSWNAATVAHNSHKGDQARYFREGGNKLYPEERDLLGNVRGLRIVHLQCNSGQDTLSLVALGATVTGVDISDEAIGFARRLSEESGVAAEFVRSDIYDWFEDAAAVGERFDLAFSSYGAVCWLSDLARWAEGIAAVLEPGGRFVVVDYHPVMGMFDEAGAFRYPYSSAGVAFRWDDGVSDYVAQTGVVEVAEGFQQGVVAFENPHPVNEFSWGIGDIVTALLDAGLMLEELREYPFANGFKRFDAMRAEPGSRFSLPEGTPSFPLMYGISARQPAWRRHDG